MLSKKPRTVIGILTGLLISGNKSGIAATTTRTTKAHQSPEGLKKSFDFGGVGLGIVAALEKSGDVGRGEFPALFGRNMSRSRPIPVKSCPRNNGALEENEVDSFEEYTVVTCHAPSKSYTKVYCDSPFRIPSGVKGGGRASVFTISPARFGDVAGAPEEDFLSSCHLCHKKLHGEDIYMYRGEKAFCSTECRYRQIAMDERKEKCSSEASRSVDLSTSPYTNGQIFTTGILAT